MKAAITSALLLASTEAAIQNSVPIQSHYPGWFIGTKGADVKLTMFYDLFCPDSRDTHYALKELLTMKSPVAGKTYEQLVEMTITPFVLPYHNHSFKNTQIMILMQDLCKANKDKCYMEKFAEFCWANWQEEQDLDKSEDVWTKYWAKKVVPAINDPEITEEVILSLYDREHDKHDSDWRVREDWKYATSRGASGTPVAFFNGVKLDSVPTTTKGWDDLFRSIFTSEEEKEAVEEIVEAVLEPIIDSINEASDEGMFLY